MGPRIQEATFGKVLLADVRDTAFQSDPFSVFTSPGLYAFAEDVEIGCFRVLTPCLLVDLMVTISDCHT